MCFIVLYCMSTCGALLLLRDGAHAVVVVPVNDPPELTVQTAAQNFTEGSEPIKVDPTLTLADPDSTQISGAVVWLEPEGEEGDALDVSSAALEGRAVRKTLKGCCRVQLYTVASLADYQAALRGLTYHSSSRKPSTLR